MPGKLTGYSGNTVSPASSAVSFNPLFYKDEKGAFEPLGNMNGIFLSDQKSIDAYPFGDSPVLSFNLAAGFNKLFSTNYEYANYYGIKFSVQSNPNYTPQQLNPANKEDMFSAKITANLYQDQKLQKVDNSQGWFIQPDTPLTTLSLFFGASLQLADYQQTYNSTNSSLGGKLIACMRPEAPYLFGVNKYNPNQPSEISSLRRDLANMVCYQPRSKQKETPCPKTNSIDSKGTITLRIPNYFAITGPATFPFEVDAKTLIYTVDEDPNYRYTIVEVPSTESMPPCDIYLGILFFEKFDLLLKYDVNRKGQFSQQIPWNIAFSKKSTGFNIYLVMVLAGMFLGLLACVGCVCFFRRGSKGGHGKENILEDFVAKYGRLVATN